MNAILTTIGSFIQTANWDLNETASLLWRVVVCLLLTGLPCLAACAFAIRKGVRNRTLIGLVAMAALAGSGYLSFWLWFLNPVLGDICSFCLPVASAAYLYFSFRAMPPVHRELLKCLLLPMGLTAAAALLVLSTGFMYGGLDDPFHTPTVRFSHPLPPDNSIPYMFAMKIERRDTSEFIYLDWRSSDRPPLQTGIVLSEFAYFRGEKNYAVLATVLQSTWIFALYLFLTALDISRVCVRLALTVCLFSGFIFVNSFFVWPKLLAAAYMLGCFTILFGDQLGILPRQNAWTSVLAGSLLACGMLAHGSSMFAVLGIIVTLFLFRRREAIRRLPLVLGTSLVVYLPWMAYQKFYNPPGDRLLKYHLAGVSDPDPHSFIQVLLSAYRKLTFHDFVSAKWFNIQAVFDHWHDYLTFVTSLLRHLGTDSQSISIAAQNAAAARSYMFFFLVPNLAFLVLGCPALFIGAFARRHSREWRVAALLWSFIAVTVAIWLVIMFTPGSTVIHQGAYLVVIFAYVASILALWALQPWFAIVLGALQVCLSLLVYGITIPVPIPDGHLRIGMLVLSLMALGLFCRLITRVPSVSSPKPDAECVSVQSAAVG